MVDAGLLLFIKRCTHHVALPDYVDVDRSAATLHDGFLALAMPIMLALSEVNEHLTFDFNISYRVYTDLPNINISKVYLKKDLKCLIRANFRWPAKF